MEQDFLVGSAGQGLARVLVVLPPARISHEIDMYRSMDDVEVVVVAGHGSGVTADFQFPVVRIPYVGAPDRWAAGLNWLRGATRVDPGDVDVVVSLELLSTGSLIASELARRLGRPHVVHVADVLQRNPLYHLPPWRQITRRVVESATAFVCDTYAARDLALARGVDPRRASVVYPGVDLEEFRPADALDPMPTLVFAGDLRPDRGLEEIISACDALVDEVDRLRLVVMGDGPIRRRIEVLALERPYVELRGRVPRSTVADVFRGARLFVAAPHERIFWSEQFGFAMVEALATGLPVVATRSGAIPEVLPEGNLLVPEHDVAGLEAAIRRLLGPRGDVVGRRNARVARERYGLPGQAAKLRELLAGVATGSRLAAS